MKKTLLVVSSAAAQLLVGGVVFAQDVTSPTVSIPIRQPNDAGNPFNDVIALITKFGGWLLLAAGALAVVFLIIGGIRYLVSAGNSTQTEGAKKTIIYALAGLIIIVTSYFIVNLITSLLS